MHTSSSSSILHQSPHVADASLLPAIQNQTMASPSSSSASNSTSLGQSPGVSLLDFLRPAMSEIEQPGRTEASSNPIEIEIVDASSTTAYSSCFTSTTCSTQSAIEPVSGSSVSGAPSMASPASTTSRSVEECCGRPTIPLDQVRDCLAIDKKSRSSLAKISTYFFFQVFLLSSWSNLFGLILTLVQVDKLISISELASQVASVALGEAIDPSAQGEDGSLAELATLEWVATVSQSLQSELQTVFANLNRPQPPQQTATVRADKKDVIVYLIRKHGKGFGRRGIACTERVGGIQ
jgi:hypothetical protein